MSTEKRVFELELSDEAYKDFCIKALDHGLTPNELIENFIHDLTGDEHSNGSDEREYMDNWFQRCYFGMFPDRTFLRFMIREEYIDQLLCINEYKDNIASAEENIKIEGVHVHNSDRTIISWDKIVNTDGSQSYFSLEDYIAEEKDYIEQEQLEVDAYMEDIKELWEKFIEWTDISHGTMEEELEKAISILSKLDMEF